MPERTPQTVTLYLLSAAALGLCGLILWPLLPAIVGAITLAVVLEVPNHWLARRIRNPDLCATVALSIVILAVILPCFFLGQEIVQQAMNAVNMLRASIGDGSFNTSLNSWFGHHPAVEHQYQLLTNLINVDDSVKSGAGLLGHGAIWLANHSIEVATQLVILLFILYFLFRDHKAAVAYLRTLLPLRDDESTLLLARLDDTITATALGRLAISAVQGVLAGLGYWAAGVPGAALWAFATGIAAMIPSFGSALIWAPIVVFVGLAGHWGHAAMLALWCGGVVSVIDNFLYPMLVGTRLRSHTVTVLLSILGGVTVFGLTGIILGPVIFSTATTLLEIWHMRLNETPAQP